MAGLMEGQETETNREQGYEDSRFEVKDPISSSFHCPICMDVLNDPVMCQNNQHYFCKACITKHLKNTKNCPTCQDKLSVDTLVNVPRIVTESLSELRIRCDFYSRGCRDVVQLSDLKRHVSMCGFAAVKCSNEGCNTVVNRQDKLHHEAEVCEFRKQKCHDCVELKKQIYDLCEKISSVCKMQGDLMKEVEYLRNEIKVLKENKESAGDASFEQMNTKRNIVIAGGANGKDTVRSVEMFSWPQRTWTYLEPMMIDHCRAASVLYKNQMIVFGGLTCGGFRISNLMEGIDLSGEPGEWYEIPADVMHYQIRGHKAVTYKDSLIFSLGLMHTDCGGGAIYDNSEHYGFVQVQLNPPYSTKSLTTSKTRAYHGMELWNDQIFILGGWSKDSSTSLDTVETYEIIADKWKQMPPLPLKMSHMATAIWHNNIVIVGGSDDDGDDLDTVLMYDVVTGRCESLPSMKYKRSGCAAVITGDTLVVMGGSNETSRCLKSVEAFSFQKQIWEELPEMNERRTSASTVVKPN